ncbi:MAG: CDP-glycerol--glycerophosphate glycerophosphotransferase [Ruminococcaceae bacterium]|nr:CDP-glycerol--glycerophosphate glycerophosphotransferase [Oscillospiraceae bacterium]
MLYYIDPGTGSMLFTILIGILSAGIYAAKNIFIKLKFFLSGDKQGKKNRNTIPFVIFSDDKRYWNVFKPICDEFEKHQQCLVYMTASADDPALLENYSSVECKFVGEGNKAFAKLNMLNADIVLSSTPGLDVYQWKRSRDVKWYVHILHAANDATAYKMFGIDYFDAVLLSGEYQIKQVRQLEQLRNLPAKDLQIVGLPHLDKMKSRLDDFREGILETFKTTEVSGTSKESSVTVLLAPTWGINSVFSKYGSQIIDELIKTGYNTIIRPHPQSFVSEKEMIDDLMKRYPETDKLEWNSDNDNFYVLEKSDVLISDFSGVIFDFALVFDKPIIYADTSFDKSPLDAYWLEEDLWTFSILSKIGEQLTEDNIGNIKSVIDTCLTEPKYKDGRDQARTETWQNIGGSAERVVAYLIEKQKELSDEK